MTLKDIELKYITFKNKYTQNLNMGFNRLVYEQ